MTFALRQVELMRLVNDNRIRPLSYTKEQKKTILEKNEEVRIEKHEEVIEKWDINNEKMMSKIEAMCIRAVQMKFNLNEMQRQHESRLESDIRHTNESSSEPY